MDELNQYKTLCCNSEWIRKGRANYLCKECDKDVSLEIILLYDAIEK